MTGWTTYTITGQSQTPGQGGQPLSISMLSDSEGWAGGFTNANPQGMFMAHFDGHTWTRVAGPLASDPTDIDRLRCSRLKKAGPVATWR